MTLKKRIAFCFDLDGTLTREEILPQIAKKAGIYEEIDLLTKITLQGLITFDKSFKLRVKLLSTVGIDDVKETVSRIPIDVNLQQFVQENQENCFVVTGNLDVWVGDFVQEKYGCRMFSSVAQYEGDKLLGIQHIISKHEAIIELRKQFDYIVAIGDGMNDCSMFEIADKGIAFGGVHEPVTSLIKMSDYVCYDSVGLVGLLTSINQMEL
jgi:HAD superfamily phosphoserine phosphatase-like hydrolase